MTPAAGVVHAAVGRWVDRTALVGAAILTLSAGFVVIDGLSRWLMGTAQDWVADFGQLTLPVAIATLFVSAVQHGAMITLRVGSGARVPAVARRALDLFGQVLLLAILGLMTAALLDIAADTAAMGQVTWFYRLPMAPTWYAVAAMLAVGTGVQAVRIAAILADPSLAQPSGTSGG